jgi:hypothetical protein
MFCPTRNIVGVPRKPRGAGELRLTGHSGFSAVWAPFRANHTSRRMFRATKGFACVQGPKGSGMRSETRLCFVVLLTVSLSMGVLIAPSAASSRVPTDQLRPHLGLIPPHNPTRNQDNPESGAQCFFTRGHGALDDSPLCNAAALASIDNARATEHVAPMSFDLSAFERLSSPEQIFAVSNLERIDRGLQPVPYMTAQLNHLAEVGSQHETDPSFPSVLTGGATLESGGSIWSGGSTVLWADEGWMYADGWGGSVDNTPNGACSSATASGCWGHRDNILMSNPSAGCFIAAGAAAYGGSLSEIYVKACGVVPTDISVSWSALETSLQPAGLAQISTQVLPEPNGFAKSYSTWIEVEHGASNYTLAVTGGTLPPSYRLTGAGHLIGPLRDPRGTYRFEVTASFSAPSSTSSKWFSIRLPAT